MASAVTARSTFPALAAHWRDLSLRRKSLIIVAVPVLALAVAVAGFVRVQAVEREASDQLARGLALEAVLNAVDVHLIEAESGVRGYLLTGETSWLEPHETSRTALAEELAQLRQLVADDPDQAARAAALEPLIAERLLILDESVALGPRELGDPELAATVQRGFEAMTEARGVLAGMRTREADLAAAREAALDAARGDASVVVFAALALGAIGAVLAALLLTSGIVSRLQRVEANAARLAGGEPLDELPPAADEVGRLADAVTGAWALLAERQAARDETERELRRAVAELDDLYNNAPCGYHSLDGDGVFVRINDTELRWLGYTRDEVVGIKRFADFLTPEGLETFQASFPHFRERGEIHGLEFELRRADGTYLPVEVSATAIYDEDGRFVASRSTLVDATGRREIERAREATRAAAEEANRAKSEFVSRMSHELRTPLNAILGFSQLLELDGLSGEQAESVGYISRAGRHLLELVNEVLDISRIEAGTMTISPEPVGLRDLLAELVALVGPLAGGRRLSVDASPEACDRFVLADRQRLKQVLLNLLSNAVKYNREGGTVSIGCQVVTPDRLRVSVSDTGYGISPELQERLFRPFDRLGAEGGDVEGSGMGLALAKGLVEAMGGSIGVESTVDVGSSFWVELALTAPPADGRVPDALGARDRPRHAARTILQIEDNASNLRLVEQILSRREGHRVIAAMQGRLGVDLAREHRPNLVLLDVHLPDMNGLEVLRLLKTYPETRDVPVVVLSADATKQQAARFLAAGATDYLTKPIDVQRLLEVVGAVTGVTAGTSGDGIGETTR